MMTWAIARGFERCPGVGCGHAFDDGEAMTTSTTLPAHFTYCVLCAERIYPGQSPDWEAIAQLRAEREAQRAAAAAPAPMPLKTTGRPAEQLALRTDAPLTRRTPLIPFKKLPPQVRRDHNRIAGND